MLGIIGNTIKTLRILCSANGFGEQTQNSKQIAEQMLFAEQIADIAEQGLLSAEQSHGSLCSANILAEQIAKQKSISLSNFSLFAEQIADQRYLLSKSLRFC